MSRFLSAIVLAALLAVPLLACGKKGPLEPPPPAAEQSETEKKPKRAPK